jgi:hypothetical protein
MEIEDGEDVSFWMGFGEIGSGDANQCLAFGFHWQVRITMLHAYNLLPMCGHCLKIFV